MKQAPTDEMDDDLRPEYNLSELRQAGPRGKYVAQYRAGTNVVLLDPDVAGAFPDAAAVNQALRLVMQLAKLPAQEPALPTAE